jgi:hypothetical protein
MVTSMNPLPVFAASISRHAMTCMHQPPRPNSVPHALSGRNFSPRGTALAGSDGMGFRNTRRCDTHNFGRLTTMSNSDAATSCMPAEHHRCSCYLEQYRHLRVRVISRLPEACGDEGLPIPLQRQQEPYTRSLESLRYNLIICSQLLPMVHVIGKALLSVKDVCKRHSAREGSTRCGPMIALGLD